MIRFRKELKKPIHQYSLQNEYIKTWDSRLEAATAFGLNITTISTASKGRLKTAGGYIWKDIF